MDPRIAHPASRVWKRRKQIGRMDQEWHAKVNEGNKLNRLNAHTDKWIDSQTYQQTNQQICKKANKRYRFDTKRWHSQNEQLPSKYPPSPSWGIPRQISFSRVLFPFQSQSSGVHSLPPSKCNTSGLKNLPWHVDGNICYFRFVSAISGAQALKRFKSIGKGNYPLGY